MTTLEFTAQNILYYPGRAARRNRWKEAASHLPGEVFNDHSARQITSRFTTHAVSDEE